MAGQKSTPTPKAVDPDSIAISNPSSSFAFVRVRTREGTEYKFPDMDAAEVRRILPESGRMPENTPSLCLVNASMSSLIIQFRIIKEIYVNRELVWRCPA